MPLEKKSCTWANFKGLSCKCTKASIVSSPITACCNLFCVTDRRDENQCHGNSAHSSNSIKDVRSKPQQLKSGLLTPDSETGSGAGITSEKAIFRLLSGLTSNLECRHKGWG